MAKGENWVDYQEVKSQVSLEMVLGRYGILGKLKPSGQNLVGCCPIHQGSNPRQFSVNLERNIWNCFGNCKAGGNVLDLVSKMEQVSLREAALLLKNWFLLGVVEPGGDKVPERREEGPTEGNKAQEEAREVNPPLKFQLKTLQADHAFFTERGLLPATVNYFGLGYATKGLMKGRIAIPIHNERGELVAYCGRAVSAEQIEAEGKYKLPAGFVKSAVVFNLHRQQDNRLILVESYLSVFWLAQLGYPNTAALMGSSLSLEQERLIVSYLTRNGRALLLFDGDEDGHGCTADCLSRLGHQVFVRAVDIMAYARKPHQLTAPQLQELFDPFC